MNSKKFLKVFIGAFFVFFATSYVVRADSLVALLVGLPFIAALFWDAVFPIKSPCQAHSEELGL